MQQKLLLTHYIIERNLLFRAKLRLRRHKEMEDRFMTKLQKRLALPILFVFAVVLLLGTLGTTAEANDIAGPSTRLYLRVTGDPDHDATFLVTYTDGLGAHTKTYTPGMAVPAWSPVTITCADHAAEYWTLDADVQENWLQGVGGVTTHGAVFRVTGTNTVRVFATNVGLHYIYINVGVNELGSGSTGGDTGGSTGGGDTGGGDISGGDISGGDTGGGDTGGGGDGTDPSGPNDSDGGNPGGGGTDPSGPDGPGGDPGVGGDPSDPGTPGGGGDPGSPENPGTPDGGGSTVPKTGDVRMDALLWALLLLSALVFAATYLKKKHAK